MDTKLLKKDIAIALSVLIVFVAMYAALQLLLPTTQAGSEIEVTIERGMSFRAAVSALSDHGLIRDESIFVAMGRFSGLHKKLRPGRYVFTGAQSPWSVYSILRDGRVKLWAVTINEGDNLDRIGRKLVDKGLMNAADFKRLSHDRQFLSKLNITAPSLEGYLFPDTYLYSKGISPERILSIMVNHLRHVTKDVMQHAEQMDMNENEVLALASIIEKEAYLDEERETISAVYHNRLRRGIQLQADPTVVYGIKPLGTGITRADLRRDTPYNTYFIKGLPPGPIASPGLPSIKAALSPADVSYIFFVSNNDGSHVFTNTLREHERAVKAYRVGRSIKNRKKREDSKETQIN